MNEIITERSGPVLRVTLNRPEKKNAITGAMYTALANLLNDAGSDDAIRVVLLQGAGDSFTAGNDVGDFLKHPPGEGGAESPQEKLIAALINFDKPLVAAVHGAAVGSGTTILTHCDFVFASENSRFQMPFINLALVPEFGVTFSAPAQFGYLAAAELLLLGLPFDAKRAVELGLVTRVTSEQELLATANATAEQLAKKPIVAIRASKRLLKLSSRPYVEAAAKAEIKEFVVRVRSAEAKEAFTAFLEKRAPDFTKINLSKEVAA